MNSSGSHHTSTHTMYVSEHTERRTPTPSGKAPMATFQEMQVMGGSAENIITSANV